MIFFYRTVGLFILIILSLSLSADISNIQYEGTWDRAYYYDWGFAEKDGKLYVGSHTCIERYSILENGDLAFDSLTDNFNGIITDMHIAGDMLYVITYISNQYERYLYIYDISQDNFEQTARFELKPGFYDNSIFSDSEYVYFFSFCEESYYMERSTGVLQEIEFSVNGVSNYLEPYLFDSVLNEAEDTWYVRIRDISDINNPEQVFLGLFGTLGGYDLTSVNNNTIMISTTNDEDERVLKFIDVSDISNLQQISEIEIGYYSALNLPVLVSDEHVFISSAFGGTRSIINISDLDNPVLECEWYLGAEVSAWKTIAYEDYFYVKRGDQGISKYSLSQLPLSEPENYFGEMFQTSIMCSFDGNRVIIYERDKIIKKEFPDDEGTVIYQDEAIDNYNGYFACNDSLVIVRTYQNGQTEIKIIETDSGEIKSSYDNLPFCQQIKYIEPYFYLYSYTSNYFKVYEIDSNWNLIEIANIAPTGANRIDVWEFFEGKIWVYTGARVFLYDTENFDYDSDYVSSFFTGSAETPYLRFITEENVFCVQYGYNNYARFYRYLQDSDPELIETVYFGEYNSLSYLEDTVISARISFSSYLYHISDSGLSEPYAELNFGGNLSWFEFDEPNNRIFIRKFGSYESFTYNYFVDIMEEEIPINNELLSVSNYPNPFNPITTISFNLAKESNVSVEVFNIKGQKVKTLINENMDKGEHSIIWNGLDENNKVVGSGVYLYKVITDDRIVKTSKMMLAK